ncbi:hypothetical protein ACER0C_013516 [Sarotherodon galilaeus]
MSVQDDAVKRNKNTKRSLNVSLVVTLLLLNVLSYKLDTVHAEPSSSADGCTEATLQQMKVTRRVHSRAEKGHVVLTLAASTAKAAQPTGSDRLSQDAPETQTHVRLPSEMKLNVLLWLAALLGAVLPRSADSRPAAAPADRCLLTRPLLLHLGQELSLRMGGGSAAPELLSSSSSAVKWALLQLTRRLLQARAEQQQDEEEEAGEKGKRSDEPPISLDLTFHLLREVLEMARAEQIAQQADSNRMIMDTFGK